MSFIGNFPKVEASAYSAPVVLNPSFSESTDRGKLGLIANNAFVSLYIQGFKTTIDTTAHPHPLEVIITKDNEVVTPSYLVCRPLKAGVWEIRFSTSGLKAGLYNFEVLGEYQDIPQVLTGHFELANITRSAYLIQKLRYLLFDYDVNRYHVNLYNEVNKWDDAVLAVCLDTTLDFLNGYKVKSHQGKGLTLDNVPKSIETVLIQGALAQAFRTRQTYEIAEAHTIQGVPMGVTYTRDYSTLAQQYQQLYDESIKNTWIGDWILNSGIFSQLGRGRHLRYVENFVLMAMVPFGHNTWVI